MCIFVLSGHLLNVSMVFAEYINKKKVKFPRVNYLGSMDTDSKWQCEERSWQRRCVAWQMAFVINFYETRWNGIKLNEVTFNSSDHPSQYNRKCIVRECLERLNLTNVNVGKLKSKSHVQTFIFYRILLML